MFSILLSVLIVFMLMVPSCAATTDETYDPIPLEKLWGVWEGKDQERYLFYPDNTWKWTPPKTRKELRKRHGTYVYSPKNGRIALKNYPWIITATVSMIIDEKTIIFKNVRLQSKYGENIPAPKEILFIYKKIETIRKS